MRLFRAYQNILSRDVPMIPLYVLVGVDIWNKKFAGFEVSECWHSQLLKCANELRLLKRTAPLEDKMETVLSAMVRSNRQGN